MKKYKLSCEILSPIHIGSGRVIEPLDYIIENSRLYKVSFEKLVIAMDEVKRNKFEEVIDNENLVDIRKHIAGNINKDNGHVYSLEVSRKIEDIYKSKMNDIQNQLLMSPFIRTAGEALPFIPGSSFKGSLRTAIINSFAKDSKLPKPKEPREVYQFESNVMAYKDGKDDPFRGIRIRDAFLSANDTIIRDVINVSRKQGSALRQNSIQNICEVTHSVITGKSVDFTTELSLDNDLFGTKFLSRSLTIEQLIKSCNEFYKDKMEYEHKKFFKNSEVEKISEQLLGTSVGGNTFLMRLGRFSGVESVTFDKYRNPRPPGNKSVWGTSRNLVEGMYPMGWIKVSIIEEV